MKFKCNPFHIYMISIQTWLIHFVFKDIKLAETLAFPLTHTLQSPLKKSIVKLLWMTLAFFHVCVEKNVHI